MALLATSPFLAAAAIFMVLMVASMLGYLVLCWRDGANPLESNSRYPLTPFAVGLLTALGIVLLIGLALLRRNMGLSP